MSILVLPCARGLASVMPQAHPPDLVAGLADMRETIVGAR
jgi:hypothetical protein